MSDVFLSYSREDREYAKRLVGYVELRGWSVWWDNNLRAGTEFEREIEAALESAGVVIPIWSEASARSEWVIKEATHGNERGVLIPTRLDHAEIPPPFARAWTWKSPLWGT